MTSPARPELLPLSYQQEQLWYLENLNPGTPTYTMTWGLRLHGDLDRAALRGALDDLVARHETLRTTFTDTPGGPRRAVTADPRMPLTVTDLTGLDSAARERRVSAIHLDLVGSIFDLRHGPPLCARLLLLTPEEHVLIVAFHHIVVDGWSLRTLNDDLAALYNGRRAARVPRLSEPATYGDYVRWQREALTGDRLAELTEHWRSSLDGAVAAEVPRDRLRPGHVLHRGEHVRHRLNGGVAAAVGKLAAAERCTPFMVQVACFVAVLNRYSGRDDLTFGMAAANRTPQEFEDTVGLLVNMLALRVDVGDDPTFRALVRRVRGVLLNGLAHQELPFSHVVQAVNPARDASRAPLFQIALNSGTEMDVPPVLDGLRVTLMPGQTRAARNDLTVEFGEDGQCLTVTAEYSTELFERDTVERLLRHYATLLTGALALPGSPVGRLPMLNDKEQWQAIHGRNAHVRPCADADPLHRLFERRARRSPGRPAVSDARRTLTYAELDGQADLLAHRLRDAGVRPGDLVGICLRRSVRVAVAVLATLKAGAAYVPLDPTAPAARLTAIVEDARSPVVIGERALAHLVEPSGTAMLDLDACDLDGTAPGGPPDVETRPEDLAYVIYTSGSTGRPKGTLVEHRNVTSLLNAAGPLFDLRESDVWAQFHSYAFDVSVWEMWGAWSHGARLVMVPEEVARSPEELRELLVAQQVTVLCQTPTAFAALDRADAAAPANSQLRPRYVILAGEVLDFSRLRDWFDRHGDRAPVLVNMYGPTETTVYVTHRVVTAGDVPAGGSRLGVSLPNARSYIVDERLRPVPVGVPGELLIGGECVARGYLNRAGLTSELFIRYPPGSGERCYRTGDLVRETSGGDMEYLGRMDDQVKVRGFRVEPGEVAVALRAHPWIRDAAVVARDGESLCSYIVPADGCRPPHRDELRAFLARSLPPYMIPAAFIPIRALPMNRNGKLDRAALPAPRAERGLRDAPVVPRTEHENDLARLWCETLGLAGVGIDDDYFVLGGHSLGAARLVAWIRERYGAGPSLRDFLAAPTIRALAGHLAEARDSGAGHLVEGRDGKAGHLVEGRDGKAGHRCRVTLSDSDPARSRTELNLVHPAGGSVLCYRALARELSPAVAVTAFQSPMLEGGPPLTDVESTAAHFLAELGDRPALLGGWSFGGMVAFEMARRLAADGRWTGPLILIDTAPPGSLDEDDETSEAEFRRYVERVTGTGAPDLTAVEWDAHLSIFRAHAYAQRDYRPSGPLPGDILLFAGAALPDPVPWLAHATGRVTIRRLPADHYELMEPPHVGAIARYTAQRLRAYTKDNHGTHAHA
ncbi:amino acid adenylation domain-containing protein [Nonomuraea sp. NPDC050404]|uniref:non-ribosomal peptide synthetase n=1 Tax=Nonomuraea sp. NPDC050404 TaxID=3155783 RepID=UPI0033CF77C8